MKNLKQKLPLKKISMLDQLKHRLMKMDQINEADKQAILNNLLKIKKNKIHILVTGATGSGKSSTINAIFNTNVAKVGMGVDPETMDIKNYQLDDLVIYDSPGFGDGIEQDKRHAIGIKKLLNQTDVNGHCKIDLVLVLLDGGSRDYGTTYQLLERVIIPNIGNNDCRILLAINQADMAMNGKGWEKEFNRPTEPLIKQLENKVNSTQARIKTNTGIDIEPIYYCAGYQDEVESQRPYNLSKLLYFIVQNIPHNKRYKIADNMNTEEILYDTDDGIREYIDETKKSFAESLLEAVGNVVDDTTEIVKDVVTSVVNGTVNLGRKLVSAGSNVVSSFCSGVANLFRF